MAAVSLPVEYAQWELTRRLLARICADIKPFDERQQYEASNVLERWLITMVNARTADPVSVKDPAEGPSAWPTIYRCTSPSDDFNRRLIAELAEKRISPEPRLLAEEILKLVAAFVKGERPARPQTVRCAGGQITYGEFSTPLNPRAREALRLRQPSAGEDLECSALAAMALRYATLVGGGQQWGLSFKHARELYESFGIRNEAFASPLNSRFAVYKDTAFCSLFKDTDAPFGSVGSFFELPIERMLEMEGNWMANPPFVETLMAKAAEKFVEFLEGSSRRGKMVTVFFLLPAWTDASAFQTLARARFLRASVRLNRGQYQFESPSGSIIPAKVDCQYFFLSSMPFGAAHEVQRATAMMKGLLSRAEPRTRARTARRFGGAEVHLGPGAVIIIAALAIIIAFIIFILDRALHLVGRAEKTSRTARRAPDTGEWRHFIRSQQTVKIETRPI